MTDEQIAKLYDQALVIENNGDYVAGEVDPVKFAKLVAQHEREACAELRKTLSAIPNSHVPQLQPAVDSALDFYAERIRARGEQA